MNISKIIISSTITMTAILGSTVPAFATTVSPISIKTPIIAPTPIPSTVGTVTKYVQKNVHIIGKLEVEVKYTPDIRQYIVAPTDPLRSYSFTFYVTNPTGKYKLDLTALQVVKATGYDITKIKSASELVKIVNGKYVIVDGTRTYKDIYTAQGLLISSSPLDNIIHVTAIKPTNIIY